MSTQGVQPITVGVLGVGRGMSFAQNAELAGMKLVALCDTWEAKLQEARVKYSVATYTDFEKFLEHDMDAVVVANYFHEHAPFAIKALEAGKHVLSETSCNATIAEGVALCRAVERTRRIYMLAENYPYCAFNQEMKRIYRSGEIGEVTYAEGEYNHPMSAVDRMKISPGMRHWRNWNPSTYYCTHALAPLVYMTDVLPVSVNALSIACREVDKDTVRTGDPGAVTLCRMSNGSVFKLFGVVLPGHSIWYRVHGTRGAMETTRGPGYWGPGHVRVWHEEWDDPPDGVTERTWLPRWRELADLANKTGHGGGDFWVDHHFAEAIRTGTQPFLNVYRGVAMSSVGILAWKSALQDGAPFAVPDFSDEAVRRRHENDTWSPFPSHAAPGQPAPSILGIIEPADTAVKHARKIWAEQGYSGT